jgi:hypothetical protein
MTGPRFSRSQIEDSLHAAACSLDEARDVIDPKMTETPSLAEWRKAADKLQDAATRVAYALRYARRRVREEA